MITRGLQGCVSYKNHRDGVFWRSILFDLIVLDHLVSLVTTLVTSPAMNPVIYPAMRFVDAIQGQEDRDNDPRTGRATVEWDNVRQLHVRRAFPNDLSRRSATSLAP